MRQTVLCKDSQLLDTVGKILRSFERQQVVYLVLYKVNDVAIRNIADVAIAIATATGPMITFEFCTDECIVLPLKEGSEATIEIREDYGMAAVVSIDVADALASKGIQYLGSTNIVE